MYEFQFVNRGSLTRYSGNETAILEVMIVDSGTVIADEFDAVQIKLEVAFSSGSATKSFYEGELY